MGNPLWFLLWLIIFIFISWIVAEIGAFLYVWSYLFLQCCDCCQGPNEFFLKCMQFPGYCWKAMVQCKPMC